MSSRQLKWILIIAGIGSVASIISYMTEVSNLCPIQQLEISGAIQKYDSTKDAQFCDTLNTKISKFNNVCKSNIEELDCG